MENCALIIALSLYLILITNIYLTNIRLCQDAWYMDKNLVIEKMKAQFEKETQNISTAHTRVELCAITVI